MLQVVCVWSEWIFGREQLVESIWSSIFASVVKERRSFLLSSPAAVAHLEEEKSLAWYGWSLLKGQTLPQYVAQCQGRNAGQQEGRCQEVYALDGSSSSLGEKVGHNRGNVHEDLQVGSDLE